MPSCGGAFIFGLWAGFFFVRLAGVGAYNGFWVNDFQ